MRRLRNKSPLGQIDVPILNRQGLSFDEEGEPTRLEGQDCLEPGEEFDVPEEIADQLLESAEHFEEVKAGGDSQ